jgi:hypothetical protein
MIWHGPYRKWRVKQFYSFECTFIAAVKFLPNRCQIWVLNMKTHRLMGRISTRFGRAQVPWHTKRREAWFRQTDEAEGEYTNTHSMMFSQAYFYFLEVYQIFWEVVGLERCSLSLVSTVEELHQRKSTCSGLESRDYSLGDSLSWPRDTLYLQKELLGGRSSDSGLEIREFCRRDPLCWSRNTLYPQKLALTSPTSDGRSISIVRSRTKDTEFVVWVLLFKECRVRRGFILGMKRNVWNKLFLRFMMKSTDICINDPTSDSGPIVPSNDMHAITHGRQLRKIGALSKRTQRRNSRCGNIENSKEHCLFLSGCSFVDTAPSDGSTLPAWCSK